MPFFGTSRLCDAIKNNRIDRVTALVSGGVDINKLNSNGQTPQLTSISAQTMIKWRSFLLKLQPYGYLVAAALVSYRGASFYIINTFITFYPNHSN